MEKRIREEFEKYFKDVQFRLDSDFPTFEAGYKCCDEEIKKLKEIITQVHSWIVCSSITTPEDMMNSADWIEDITDLSESRLYNTKESE